MSTLKMRGKSRDSVIYDGQYMSVSSDGIMSFSDGVGCLGSVGPEETYELYLALTLLYLEMKGETKR